MKWTPCIPRQIRQPHPSKAPRLASKCPCWVAGTNGGHVCCFLFHGWHMFWKASTSSSSDSQRLLWKGYQELGSDSLEGISRHPDTRDPLDRWNGSQLEALPELLLQRSVIFPFTGGSLTFLSPPIKRGLFFLFVFVLICFAANGDYYRDRQLVKIQRLSVYWVPREFRRGWDFEQLWDY